MALSIKTKKALDELSSHVFRQWLHANTAFCTENLRHSKIKDPTTDQQLRLLARKKTFEKWTRWRNALKCVKDK